MQICIKKNHSLRTYDKQIELAIILQSYLQVKRCQTFTYCDLNGGTGEYIIDGNICKGGCIIAHDVLDRQQQKDRRLSFNGHVFETGKTEWPMLKNSVATKLKDCKFQLHNQDSVGGLKLNLPINSRYYDSANPPVKLLKQMYADGVFYFDPNGDVCVSAVKAYSEHNPNYMILCNWQRNVAIRHLHHTNNISSAELITSIPGYSWLLSPPVERTGWTWLVGIPDKHIVTAFVDIVNAHTYQNKALLYKKESNVGQVIYKLITEKGHNIHKYFNNKYDYIST